MRLVISLEARVAFSREAGAMMLIPLIAIIEVEGNDEAGIKSAFPLAASYELCTHSSSLTRPASRRWSGLWKHRMKERNG